jgi:hypothetical protein
MSLWDLTHHCLSTTEVSLTNLRSKINNYNNKNKSKATKENISLKILFACRVPLGIRIDDVSTAYVSTVLNNTV